VNPRYAQGEHEGIIALVAKTLHNSFRGSLWIFHGGKGSHEISANAVSGENQQVAPCHGKDCGLQLRQVVADDAPSQQKRLL
jgi:hypothetical protein